MEKYFQKLKTYLRKYWNLWGGAIIAVFIAWLKDFNKTSMDKMSGFLMLTILV